MHQLTFTYKIKKKKQKHKTITNNPTRDLDTKRRLCSGKLEKLSYVSVCKCFRQLR